MSLYKDWSLNNNLYNEVRLYNDFGPNVKRVLMGRFTSLCCFSVSTELMLLQSFLSTIALQACCIGMYAYRS